MAAVTLIAIVFVALAGCSPKNQSSLEKVDSYPDLHGLAVKPDGDVFITTHDGLLLLKDDADLYRVGKEKGDLMGFVMNPRNPDQVYASGHPANGGNLGVIASRDGGVTWRRIFKNIGKGAVDFHAMAISLADPRVIYGWYEDKLYRTDDGGHTWRFARAKGLSRVVTLATSPRYPDTVYAGTVDGLFYSADKGETWLVEEANNEHNYQVLDLGCGTATLTILTLRANHEATIIGMDGDSEVLKIARMKTARLGLDIPLIYGMSYELPHRNNCFDCARSSLLFHHLTRENKIRTFEEAFRVLRSRGMLLVADFGMPRNAFMRLFSQRFEETSDNVKGLLPCMAQDAGFQRVKEFARYGTVFGTLSLFAAQKPYV